MQITYRAKNTETTGPLKDYAGEKLSRVGRHFDQITRVEVEFIGERNPSIMNNQIVEVTMHTKGPTIRAVEASPDMRASIDLVISKLERQIKKYKDKLYASSANNKNHKLAAVAASEEEHIAVIVRSKQVDAKPMVPEEATMQMELLGHDFFVFTNSDTEDINVVYRRKDGNFGLIEPA